MDGVVSPFSCDIQLWDFAFAGADTSVELYVILLAWDPATKGSE